MPSTKSGSTASPRQHRHRHNHSARQHTIPSRDRAWQREEKDSHDSTTGHEKRFGGGKGGREKRRMLGRGESSVSLMCVGGVTLSMDRGLIEGREEFWGSGLQGDKA